MASLDSSDSVDNRLITCQKLKDDQETEIRYVYHLSDVHIRNTQRHVEYKEVFKRTYQKIKLEIGQNRSKSLIVLTGDIMHNKTELSPEAISIVYYFFKNLLELAPVILIPGNHDCNLSNKDRMDALTPIVEDIGQLDNFYYLKKSGLYHYFNLIIAVTSVFDDTLVHASFITKKIWKSVHQKHKYKIALYHGPVHGAKTDVGYRMNNHQLVSENFDGYHYVMLGDIHRYQYLNDKNTIAYAGSLIQQSYGESLDNHGILKWDLLTQESELLPIKNDYGYCTIHITNGIMEEIKIPPKPKIRFILENTTQLQYQEIQKKLEQTYQIQEVIKESIFMTKKHHHTSHKKTKAKTNTLDTQEDLIWLINLEINDIIFPI